MASPYTGQLNANEIYSALYNMIISQQVFADNIAEKKSSLVDAARVDGSLYGDTKLYYGTDILPVHDWGNDAEAANLLALDRAPSPKSQSITLDVFKQIRLTLDNYLSKRAWGTEGAFSEFNSVMLGWLRETKEVYDATTYNTYVGTTESSVGGQSVQINVDAVPGATATNAEKEAYNRLVAQTIATEMSDLMVDIADIGTNFNDWGLTRSFGAESLIAVWNSDWVNKINKLDLPMIFHNQDLIDKKGEYTLPSRYFGKVNTSAGTAPANNSTVRALKAGIYGATESAAGIYLKAGDLLPAGTAYGASETYTVDSTIAFKLIHKRSIPYMSAFEVGTTFFNPRALCENHYLTFGHNTLDYLKNYPLVTVRVVPATPAA